MKFPVGLQLWSVRDYCEKDLEGTLKAIAELGFEGVEPYTLYNRSGEEFKALLDKYGLRAMSAHVSPYEFTNPEMGGADKVAEKYSKLGLKYIAIPSMIFSQLPGNEDEAEGRKIFDTCLEACRKFGITLLYHNHSGEAEKKENGETILDMIFNTTDICPEFDLGWVVNAGADPIEFIEKYADKVYCIHMKEAAYTGKVPENICKAVGIPFEGEEEGSTFKFLPVGEGILPVKRILEACEKSKLEYIILEQDNPTEGRDILDCVGESLKYLKSLMD